MKGLKAAYLSRNEAEYRAYTVIVERFLEEAESASIKNQIVRQALDESPIT